MSASGGKKASWLTSVVVAVLGCALLTFAVLSLKEREEKKQPEPAAPVALKHLVASSTKTTLKGAPKDDAPSQATTGLVVHPTRVAALYDAPDGKAFGKIKPTEFGDTWLPAIERTEGWVRVMLPSRPNSSTAWIEASALQQLTSPYLIRVHLGSRQLELYKHNILTGVWSVAVGKPGTPTPTGRTFVLGQMIDRSQSSSVILPLGTHSQTLDSYGGGPGTVAIHGWSDPSVFGQAVSHGCIRVPDDALAKLRAVPLGTVVLIDNK